MDFLRRQLPWQTYVNVKRTNHVLPGANWDGGSPYSGWYPLTDCFWQARIQAEIAYNIGLPGRKSISMYPLAWLLWRYGWHAGFLIPSPYQRHTQFILDWIV